MRALLLALAAIIAACTAPSQTDEARFGAVTVAFSESLDGVWDWRQDQLVELRAELKALSAVGPVFRETSEGSADVVVRAASLNGPCGLFRAGLRYVEVDAACTAGFGALKAATGHELLHFYTWKSFGWLGHVCDHPGDDPTCHATVTGPSLLAPGLARVDPGPGFSEAYTGDFVDGVPTDADLALVRALAGAR
jgi:hypothetical protein